MPSRYSTWILGLALAGTFTVAGVCSPFPSTNPAEPLPAAATAGTMAIADSQKPLKVRQQTRVTQPGEGMKFDRGRWCKYKKVQVYDKFHKETFYVDQKVCLGSII